MSQRVRARYERGYEVVYVMQFSNGVIKIGRTSNFERRKHQHGAAAQAHGHDVVASWASAPHHNVVATERALVEAMLAAGGVQRGREYFSGVSFEEACRHAAALPFYVETDEEYAARDARSNAGLEAIKRALMGRSDTAPTSTPQHRSAAEAEWLLKNEDDDGWVLGMIADVWETARHEVRITPDRLAYLLVDALQVRTGVAPTSGDLADAFERGASEWVLQ